MNGEEVAALGAAQARPLQIPVGTHELSFRFRGLANVGLTNKSYRFTKKPDQTQYFVVRYVYRPSHMFVFLEVSKEEMLRIMVSGRVIDIGDILSGRLL